MPHLSLDPISADAVIAAVAGPERGGTCVFLGTVRDEGGAQGVIGIEYSAYHAMAERELDRIEDEVGAQWSDVRVAVRHRVGMVRSGEVSVAIAAAAPHRAEAFAACRYVIEEVKRRLPVWKKEHHRDGTAVWVAHEVQPA